MGRLDGKVVIITGSASGQGRTAAQLFAAEGAKVVGCDINAEGAAETVELVHAAGDEMSSLHPCDLTQREPSQQLVQFAVATYGGIDVLYNNAAYAFFAPFAEMTPEEFDGTFAGELHIVFHVTQAAWPHLIERGGGSIVTTASTAGHRGFSYPVSSHCMGKGAVIAWSRAIASEGGIHNIRANTISPGLIETPLVKPYLDAPGYVETTLGTQLIKRIGQPEDVALTALFLASDEASFITGQDLIVDGGMTSWVPGAFDTVPEGAATGGDLASP
jgi:NAD(P)-dependent dehydrogenase (short-subunit alcohol dehydrogenase family)